MAEAGLVRRYLSLWAFLEVSLLHTVTFPFFIVESVWADESATLGTDCAVHVCPAGSPAVSYTTD